MLKYPSSHSGMDHHYFGYHLSRATKLHECQPPITWRLLVFLLQISPYMSILLSLCIAKLWKVLSRFHQYKLNKHACHSHICNHLQFPKANQSIFKILHKKVATCMGKHTTLRRMYVSASPTMPSPLPPLHTLKLRYRSLWSGVWSNLNLRLQWQRHYHCNINCNSTCNVSFLLTREYESSWTMPPLHHLLYLVSHA